MYFYLHSCYYAKKFIQYYLILFFIFIKYSYH